MKTKSVSHVEKASMPGRMRACMRACASVPEDEERVARREGQHARRPSRGPVQAGAPRVEDLGLDAQARRRPCDQRGGGDRRRGAAPGAAHGVELAVEAAREDGAIPADGGGAPVRRKAHGVHGAVSEPGEDALKVASGHVERPRVGRRMELPLDAAGSRVQSQDAAVEVGLPDKGSRRHHHRDGARVAQGAHGGEGVARLGEHALPEHRALREAEGAHDPRSGDEAEAVAVVAARIDGPVRPQAGAPVAEGGV
mmetsp:Transcript_17011/g.53469  ORF Transcript_17011/g.53469 Transcript_17011/m.53469 type:complete len:254 (-) Transcript_17011:816-1577(-)